MDNNFYTDSDGRTYQSSGDGRYFSGGPLIDNSILGLGGGDLDGFKRSSSRVHLSVFLYLLITYAVVYFVSIMLGIIYAATENELILKILESPIFNISLSSFAQYVVSFPLFVLILRSITKPRVAQREKMKLGELLIMLLICESFMLFGSIIGSYMSELIGNLFGIVPSNSVDAVINETPTWLIFVSVVILAPIFEELIFRKLFIDRMLEFGDGIAILFSALAFGLMHMNLYQFFYAMGVGLVLGYVYVRTRDVRYTIVMHMILNFMGSIVTMPIIEAQNKIIEMDELVASGAAVDEAAYLFNSLLVFLYSGLQMTLAVGGIVALVLYIYTGKLKLNNNCGQNKRAIYKAGFINVGFILFAAFSLILTVINLILGA